MGEEIETGDGSGEKGSTRSTKTHTVGDKKSPSNGFYRRNHTDGASSPIHFSYHYNIYFLSVSLGIPSSYKRPTVSPWELRHTHTHTCSRYLLRTCLWMTPAAQMYCKPCLVNLIEASVWGIMVTVCADVCFSEICAGTKTRLVTPSEATLSFTLKHNVTAQLCH